jgi:hypothetical protein
VSHRAREDAKLNRERRERKRELPRRRREWLDEQGNNPLFAPLLATLGSSVEGLRKLTEKPEAPEWGSRGPRRDPVRDIFRDALVAGAVENARTAGQSPKDAIAAGVAALRQSGSGASSEKMVEAIMARRRKAVGVDRAKAVLRAYGLDV